MGPWSRLLRIELYKSCWAGSKKLDIFCAILKQIHGMQISLLCSVPLFRVRGCFGPFWTPIPLQSYCVRISRNFSSSHGIKICPDQTLSPPREVLSILWDLHIKMIHRPDFYGVFCRNQVSPGILIIFKMVRFLPISPRLMGFPQDGGDELLAFWSCGLRVKFSWVVVGDVSLF